MKKFSLFGLKFMFEVKRSSKNDVELYSTSYALREKIIYLILIMFIIAFSSKIGLLSKNNNYSVGDVVISDIYAPKTIVFNDKSAKEKIIENMIAQSGKEYIYSADAGRIYLETFDEFFDDIYALKNNKDSNVDFKNLEKDTGRRIPDTMVKGLLSLKVPEIMKLQKETRKFLENLYESGIIQEKATIKYRSPFDKKIEKLSNLQRQVVETFAAPNYIYDEDKTKKAIEEKVSQINDQYIEIKAGTLVAKKGEILNERRIKILESCGVYSYKKSLGIMMANLTYLFIISTLFYQIIFNRYKKDYDELTNYQKKNITNGPGKLCMALEIDRSFNSQYILDSDLYISDFYIDENGEKVFADNDFEVVESKRINIDYAEEAKDYLWRYYIKGNKYVSVK